MQRRITIHCMTTADFVAQDPSQYGYVYVDGDHSFEGVSRDFAMLGPLVEASGMIVFHDVCVEKQTSSGVCGVKRFWQSVDWSGWERLTLPFEAGLGILRRLSL